MHPKVVSLCKHMCKPKAAESAYFESAVRRFRPFLAAPLLSFGGGAKAAAAAACSSICTWLYPRQPGTFQLDHHGVILRQVLAGSFENVTTVRQSIRPRHRGDARRWGRGALQLPTPKLPASASVQSAALGPPPVGGGARSSSARRTEQFGKHWPSLRSAQLFGSLLQLNADCPPSYLQQLPVPVAPVRRLILRYRILLPSASLSILLFTSLSADIAASGSWELSFRGKIPVTITVAIGAFDLADPHQFLEAPPSRSLRWHGQWDSSDVVASRKNNDHLPGQFRPVLRAVKHHTMS